MQKLEESKKTISNKEGSFKGSYSAIQESIKEESARYTENFDPESSGSAKLKSKRDSAKSSNRDSSGRFSSTKKE